MTVSGGAQPWPRFRPDSPLSWSANSHGKRPHTDPNPADGSFSADVSKLLRVHGGLAIQHALRCG